MNISKPSRLFSIEARIAALRDRHAALDSQIDDEQNRPAPNGLRLRLLKNRKLILKDEMSYYEGVLRTLRNDGLSVQMA